MLSRVLLCCLILLPSVAQAERLFSTSSLTYLNGSHYQLGDDQREVVTFEQASVFGWGDWFLFVDRLKSADGSYETYGEWAPRYKLYAATGEASGFVNAVYLAGMVESGRALGKRFNNLLYGVGIGFNLPGFIYANINLYKVENARWDNDEQMTLTWAYPFSIAGQSFLYDGFLDWSSASGMHAAEMNFTSQLKWQVPVSKGWGERLYLGLEYAHWNNKFGVHGIDERNPSLLIKWHF
ncbi:outer membrane protein OmpK [Neptuniibacter sp. CAU 1671]|uniref:outer membrane protein OmpK n=1 Tax=Neptuniibacter sp. CAU 1671 TaxID=3032593 RepID=UPI0023D9D7DB|nr:outer membrane protein OmpK [Neptuniibacter sp. CAU 1671]MDF2181110.1 outer membrane protein OmpK [Neptuniibacter sp. CAU 1671]